MTARPIRTRLNDLAADDRRVRSGIRRHSLADQWRSFAEFPNRLISDEQIAVCENMKTKLITT